MTILSLLATIFGTIGGLANVPQAYKIFSRKSAKDVSVLTYLLVLSGSIIWIFYGLEINSFPITFANSLGAVCVASVLIGWFIYNKK